MTEVGHERPDPNRGAIELRPGAQRGGSGLLRVRVPLGHPVPRDGEEEPLRTVSCDAVDARVSRSLRDPVPAEQAGTARGAQFADLAHVLRRVGLHDLQGLLRQSLPAASDRRVCGEGAREAGSGLKRKRATVSRSLSSVLRACGYWWLTVRFPFTRLSDGLGVLGPMPAHAGSPPAGISPILSTTPSEGLPLSWNEKRA